MIDAGGYERQRDGTGAEVKVRVVFVDWYRTLSTSLFWEPGAGSRLSAPDSARVESYVFSRDDLVWRWMRGTLTAEDVCGQAAGDLGLSASDLLADLEHSCRSMELYDPGSVDAIRAIRRRGIQVVLATDNMDTFTRWTAPALSLRDLFDAILDSASLGALKGDLVDGRSLFFEPWLNVNRVAPSEAVLVDDSPSGSAAAIGLGVRRVQHPGKLASILAEFAG